jgi:hypothetical protein
MAKKTLFHYLRLTEEDDPKKKTKVKDPEIAFDEPKSGVKFDDPTSKGQVATKGKRTPGALSKIDAKSADRTRRAAASVDLPDTAFTAYSEFMDRMGDMPAADQGHDDAYVYPDPEPVVRNALVPLNQMPARIVDADDPGFTPNIEWHEVRNTPGFRVPQVRAAFEPLFREMLGAPLSQIKVATDLMDQRMGGTGHRSMRALVSYIENHGVRRDDFNLEAFGIDPEIYNVDHAYVVHCDGNAFLLMRELHGGANPKYYVYVAEGTGGGTYVGGPEDDPTRMIR